MRLELGGRVRTADGGDRVLADVVVDAGGKRVTHVVVEPDGHREEARLVALELVREQDGGPALTCTTEVLEGFERVREYAYLAGGERPPEDGEWGVGVEDVLVAPSYEPLGLGEVDVDPNVSVLYDKVPKGEVELRGSSDVYSADEHHLGTIHGLDVGEQGQIAAIVLLRGHLWWKRELKIPADALATLETDVVTLGIEKSKLGDVSMR